MRKQLVLSIVILCSACKAASKDKWIDAFVPAATNALCVPQQFFRQCFELDEQACKLGMGAQIYQCLTEVRAQIPDRMSKDDGEKFGRIIGECAGSRYEIELSTTAKRRDNPKCSDPNAWINP